MTIESFDVFLSHNSKDKENVRQIGEALKERGLKVWLDEWELAPGRPWQDAIEEIIRTTNSAMVVVGKDGFGPWEESEMRACLNQFVNRHLPVIPVLLPGAAKEPDLPIFLQSLTWVDLRNGLTKDRLDRLIWGITGKKPGDVILYKDHFKDVLKAITRGKVVPFLGPGINLCDRANNHKKQDPSLWDHNGKYPPTRNELAIFLEQELFGDKLTSVQCPLCESEKENLPEDCPIKNRPLLARLLFQHVSQFAKSDDGQRVEKAINDISTHRYTPNQFHNFFAQLPKILSQKGYQIPKLIVTANFDSTLERAFNRNRQEFDLVYYVGSAKKFFHLQWRKDDQGYILRQDKGPINEPNRYEDIDLDKYPVILKLYGPMGGTDNLKENFVITEDHFIDYLAQSDISRLVPAGLLDLLHNSKILFLGYGLSHWDERVVLHRLWSKETFSIDKQKCWAIQLEPQPLDRELWKKAEVKLIQCTSMEDYITELKQQVEGLGAR